MPHQGKSRVRSPHENAADRVEMVRTHLENAMVGHPAFAINPELISTYEVAFKSLNMLQDRFLMLAPDRPSKYVTPVNGKLVYLASCRDAKRAAEGLRFAVENCVTERGVVEFTPEAVKEIADYIESLDATRRCLLDYHGDNT